jgi:pimeloyl-ACP methyl ester carboxylesterase
MAGLSRTESPAAHPGLRVGAAIPGWNARAHGCRSRGTGGSGSDMRWLVEPLVAAGFRVIAVDHHGNNYVDGYEPEGFLFVWERPRDLTFVLDVLANEQPHGPVGAAGFSVGGEDFFEPEPADPAMRSRVGADAAGFFREHLT